MQSTGSVVPSVPRLPAAVYYGVLVLASLFMMALGLHREHRVVHSRDFRAPYASARCFVQGCDPYSEAETNAVYDQAGGPHDFDYRYAFVPYSALYPPSTLLLLAPIGALPYAAAHTVWLGLICILYLLAVLASGQLMRSSATLVPWLGLVIFAAMQISPLMFGQVSAVSISLATLGVWALFQQRALLSALCFALAVCLKPHDAGILLACTVLGGVPWRKTFLYAVLFTIVIAGIGSARCWLNPRTSHWYSEWTANVHGNTSEKSVDSPERQNPESGSIMSLQPVFSVVTNRSTVYKGLSYATTLALVLPLVWFARTKRISPEAAPVLFAAAACITLLPIYHRPYDLLLAFIMFPALPALLKLPLSRRLGQVAVLLFIPAFFIWVFSNTPVQAHLSAFHIILRYRFHQLSVLLLAIVFVCGFSLIQSRSAREST